MSRWEPGARDRMTRAAVELFAERGFERTTAGDIAERAGVTERTFFRHFADKREVLFDGGRAMEQAVHDGIAAAADGVPPLDAALLGVAASTELLEARREHAARRAEIIAATPVLRERELLKLAGMAEAATAALRDRGTPPRDAELAAHAAMSVFQVAFGRWIAGGAPDLATCVREDAAELRALLADH